MTLKQKFSLIWLFAALAIGFAAHHFLGGAMSIFQNLVAFEIVCLDGAAKFGAFFLGAHF